MSIYRAKGAIPALQEGRTVKVQEFGTSMTPVVESGQVVTIEPVTPDTELQKGDVVIAKVRGRVFLHLVKAVSHHQVQISNNHGHINGWTPREQVFGRVIRGL